MYLQTILGSVKVAEWPPFGKELLPRSTYVLFASCLFAILVVCHFGFEDKNLVLVGLVTGHCYLLF